MRKLALVPLAIPSSREDHRKLWIPPLAMFAGIGLTWITWQTWGDSWVTLAFRGESWPLLNRALDLHRSALPQIRTLPYYLELSQRVYWMTLVAGLGLLGVWAFWVERRPILDKLRRFFSTADSPVNLALFRIAVFTTVLVAIQRERDLLLTLSALPPEAVIPVRGMGWLISLVPIEPRTVGALIGVLELTCVMGILGCFSRLSAIVGLALAYYLFGVYSCFGAVRQIFHILPLALAILATSRSGDVLSIDGLFHGRRSLDPTRSSIVYGLPLRVFWVILGLVYFFPGFWKLLVSGPGFINGENLRYLLWMVWAKTSSEPAIRFDRIPGALQAMGTTVMLWELAFLGLVLFQRTRLAAALFGTAFHFGSLWMMSIPFVYLNAMYVSLVDWAAGLSRLGRRLFPAALTVLYDGQCERCRRTIRGLRTLDVLGRVRYVDAFDDSAVTVVSRRFDATMLARDMHVVSGDRVLKGFEGYRALAARIPLLWPIWPLLHVPLVAAVGRRIYRRVADTRICRVAREPERVEVERAPIGVVAVGVVVASMMIVLGFLKILGCWPVSCFPTFSGPPQPVWERYERSVVLAGGNEVAWPGTNLLARMREYHAAVFIQLLGAAASRSDAKAEELRARVPRLMRHWAALDPLPQGAVALRIRSYLVSTNPDRRVSTPTRSRVVYEYDFTGDQALVTPWVTAGAATGWFDAAP